MWQYTRKHAHTHTHTHTHAATRTCRYKMAWGQIYQPYYLPTTLFKCAFKHGMRVSKRGGGGMSLSLSLSHTHTHTHTLSFTLMQQLLFFVVKQQQIFRDVKTDALHVFSPPISHTHSHALTRTLSLWNELIVCSCGLTFYVPVLQSHFFTHFKAVTDLH